MTIHDERIHVAGIGMLEGSRKAAGNLESEALPKPDRALVGADHEVELHGAEAASFCVFERMAAHGARYSSAGGANIGHVAAIGYVRASAFLIGMHVIGADYLSVVLRDEHFVARGEPVGDGLFPRHIARQGIGFTATDGRFDDFPNYSRIGRAGGPDGYHGTNIAPR